MWTWLLRPAYPKYLLGVFFAYWLAWAYRPSYRREWLLENLLLVLFVGILVATHRRFPLSHISYTLIFIFLCLHTIGAHYTYSLVPYDQWFQGIFGVTLNGLLGFERNHFDRLVHLAFGLLLTFPIREVFLRIAGARGFWGYYLPLDLTMSFSMLYELVEWGVAEIFGGNLGQAYLGTQGDVWDAHKDMVLAVLGAVLSISVTAGVNWRFQRGFAQELRRSLAVKQREPLGDARLREILKDQNREDKKR